MKTLLKNGVVVDGSGSNRYQADVLIDGDKIVKSVRLMRQTALKSLT